MMDELDVPLKETILDIRGVDLYQDVGNDDISQLNSAVRSLSAFALSLTLHAAIVAVIAIWWLQIPRESSNKMTHLFQVSINPSNSEKLDSSAEQNSEDAELDISESSVPELAEQEKLSAAENIKPQELFVLPNSETVLLDQQSEPSIAMQAPVKNTSYASKNDTEQEAVVLVEPVLAAIEEQQALMNVGAELKLSPKQLNLSGQNSENVKADLKESLLSKSNEIEISERNMIEEKIKEFIVDSENEQLRSASLNWQENGVSYQAKISTQPVTDVMELESLNVDLRRTKNGQEVSTDLHYKRLAFSSYAQIVNRWDDDVYISEDVFEGRFHSNSSINIDAGRKFESIFLGKVTIASFRNPPKKYGDSDNFKEGLELGAEKITLPKDVSPLDGELPPSAEQVHYFSQDSSIRFLPDGRYEWSVDDSNEWLSERTIHADASYLLAENGVKLSVQGEVSGKVIVYSPERITVVGNIVYSQDPRIDSNSNDYLGLVSEKNVEIAEPKIIGDGDLEIHAAIYAKRRFSVRRFRARTKAVLTILGSVSAGSLSATEPRYATQVLFDKRLEKNRPPLFPVTDQYELNYWNPVWQQESL